MPTIRILFALTVIAACSVAAVAETFTFDATDGIWGDSQNWDPPGTPGSADTAIIPSGKTCRIEDADRDIKILDVQSGGTLRIDSRKLTVHQTSGTGVTVNGTLQFKQTGPAAAPVLFFNNSMTLNGSGTINARENDGYGPAEMEGADDDDLTITDTTLVGSIDILAINLKNGGTIKVDDADDSFRVGESPSAVEVWGSGTFEVSAGLLQFRHVRWTAPGRDFTGPITISGGTMQFDGALGGGVELDSVITLSAGTMLIKHTFSNAKSFTMSGGKLQIDKQNSRFNGDWTYTGGTIELAAGRNVMFK